MRQPAQTLKRTSQKKQNKKKTEEKKAVLAHEAGFLPQLFLITFSFPAGSLK